jgi:hypothetical protein
MKAHESKSTHFDLSFPIVFHCKAGSGIDDRLIFPPDVRRYLEMPRIMVNCIPRQPASSLDTTAVFDVVRMLIGRGSQ